MEILGNNLGAKKGKKGQKEYYCEKCEFTCSKKYNWERHISTSKHTEEIFGHNFGAKGATSEIYEHICQYCNQKYKTNSGLWKHTKKCIQTNKTKMIIDVIKDDKNVQDFLMEQNKQLIEQLSQQNKQLIEQNNKLIELSQGNTIGTMNNTINTNSNNKFNINVFLNETCKDAMNIMEFVDSLKLQLSDLENVGKLGYVEGISKIIVSNLKSLDETKRPVHCTDSKREVMYVKDEDKWEKENENKQKMRKVIKHVTHKNSKLLKDFKNKYPGCDKSESKYSDKYDKLIIEAMGGKGDNDAEKEDKIIKKIAKNVSIDKYIE